MLMIIKYKSPINDFTGLGEASRLILNSLNKIDAKIFIEEINISMNPHHEIKKISNIINSSEVKENNYINFVFCPPHQFSRFIEKDKINIGYTMWETDDILDEYKPALKELDLLFVPCEFNKKIFSKYVKKIEICPLIKSVNYIENIKKKEKYNFYNICELTERKSILESIQAYFLEFQNNDNVNFFLKINGNKEELLRKVHILQTIMKLKSYPPLEIIDNTLSDEELDRIHLENHCYVGPSKGEGWNLPLSDAALFCNQIISTDTGCVEFFKDENVYIVDSKFEPVLGCFFFEFFNASQNWLLPSINSIRNCMRKAYEEKNNFFNDDFNIYYKEKIKEKYNEDMVLQTYSNIFRNLYENKI
jgi:hypothetical protein